MPMNIVVCVKQVRDTAVERTLRPGDGTLDRQTPDGLINELDEYAIEEGLKIAEAHGGEVTILSMGPSKAAESIRKALSMGADKAVLVTDDALAGSDAVVTGSLPAVVSVNVKINEPRYPTFKGIMAAKKKPVQNLTLADLGLEAGSVGLANAASWVEDFAAPPPR